MKQKRRGIRLNSRVPVAIEWHKNGVAPPIREEAFTRVVGPYGCLIVLRESLELEQSLKIVNLATWLRRESFDSRRRLIFVGISALPHRPNPVDHIFCRQIVSFGRFCVAGFATTFPAALGKHSRPRRSMDGAVHTASARQF